MPPDRPHILKRRVPPTLETSSRAVAAPERPHPAPDPWALSVPEAARLAGVSERTLWSWVKGGRLHVVRFGGITRVGSASLKALTMPGESIRYSPAPRM